MLTKRYKLACLIFIFIFLHEFSVAQIGGSKSFQFLRLPASARIAALGGYIPVVADADLSLVSQNPSLLNPRMNNMWSLNFANFVSDIRYGYISTGQHIKDVGTFAISLQTIDYGDFVARDVIGNETGNFTASENAFNISFARPYKQFSYGANVKFIFSHFESYNSTAIALDLGGSYTDSASGLGLSFSIINIGTQVKSYYGNKEELPFEALFSISKKLENAPFRFTLTLHDLQKFDLTYDDPNSSTNQVDLNTGKPIKESFSLADKLMRHVAVGTELVFSPNFNLRVGYSHQTRAEMKLEEKPSTVGFSWGFGIRVKKFDFSYGSARYHLSGSNNMFTLAFNPNEMFRKKKSNS